MIDEELLRGCGGHAALLCLHNVPVVRGHSHSHSSLGYPAHTPISMSSLVMIDVPVLW